jgi:hypothetical protein
MSHQLLLNLNRNNKLKQYSLKILFILKEKGINFKPAVSFSNSLKKEDTKSALELAKEQAALKE